jgi:putative ABC transport system permease protein
MALFRILTLRSLRSRPLRMLLSVFGIMLGVAAILGIGITNQTALDSVTRLFKDTSGRIDLTVTSAKADPQGYSDSILSRLRSLPQVKLAIPLVNESTLLVGAANPTQVDLSFFGAQVGGFALRGVDPQLEVQARDYRMIQGRFLSTDLNADEIVLVKDFAEENDIQVGRFVEIIADTGVEKLRVVGLMAKEGPGQENNGSFGVIPLVTAQKLFFKQGKVDQIDLVVSPSGSNSAELESIRKQLQDFLGEDYSVVYPASQGQRMTQMLSNYQIGLNFLSGMALFVGAFLIYNAFSMSVVERTREFGMLRTIGMTRSQIVRQVLSEALILGVFGSLLGLALGLAMARGLSQLMAIMLRVDLAGAEAPRELVATAVTVGILVAVLAALLPALQAGRISPLEALRIRGNPRPGWLMRYGWLLGLALLIVSAVILVLNPFPYDVQFRMGSLVVISLFLGGALVIPASVSAWERMLRPALGILYGRSGRIGGANVQRAKLRTALTVAALMIGVSMVVIVWVMTDSFKGDLDAWLEGYMGGDLYVTSSLPMGRDVWKRLEAVPGVAAAAPVRYFDMEWKTPTGDQEKLVFMAIDPASYNRVTSFIFSQGQPDAQQAVAQLALGESVFISSVLSEKYGLKAGDTVTLLTKNGEHRFNVAAVVVDYFNQGLVISGNWADMERYFRQKDANAFLIKVTPGSMISEVQDRIDKLYGERDRLIISSNQNLLERVTRLMDQAFGMFDVLALIAILVGFFGVVNTITMNVIERTREIGMLRSIGMTRGQILSMILSEGALMGLIGGVLGLVFGAILSRIFMLAMSAMSGYSLEYVFPVQKALAAVLIALVVSQVAAIFPAQRAARVRILEAIQYE